MTTAVLWQPRRYPLTPTAVAAQGEAAQKLTERLLACDKETLSRLKGVAGPEWIVVLGEESLLPWVDGAIYLGRDALAPALLLPTTLEPSVPLPLLEKALRRQAPTLAAPIAVLPETHVLFSLASARTIAREMLLRRLLPGV